MKRKEEEQRRNTLRTLETSSIFKNSKSKQELKKERSKKREKDKDSNYWLLKSIRRDSRKRD